MADLSEHLRRIERSNPAPDLWGEITIRPAGPASRDPREGGRRVVAALTAAMVSVAAIGFLVWAFRPGNRSGVLEQQGPGGPTVEGEATQLPGIDDYRVCRVHSLPGKFGDAGDEVVVFEEEHTPGVGCGSEGWQHIAVLRDGRVTSLSRRITDLAGDEAWRVWPYATPDLDGDGTDEIAVAGTYASPTLRVWFFTLAPGGGGIDAIYIPGGTFGPSQVFTHWIQPPGSPSGPSPRGVACRGKGDARRIVTWKSSPDDDLTITETSWRLRATTVQFESERTIILDGLGPLAGDDDLCGSPVADPPESYRVPGDIATRAELTCATDGTTSLSTDTVQPMPDGVHIRVNNEFDEPVSVEGFDANPGITDWVLTDPPGTMELMCWPFSQHEDDEPRRIPLEIVDPLGLHVNGSLSCDTSAFDGFDVFGTGDVINAGPPPLDVARRVISGLRADDVLGLDGYPEQEGRSVIVILGGEVIARYGITRLKGEWWVVASGSACKGTGLPYAGESFG